MFFIMKFNSNMIIVDCEAHISLFNLMIIKIEIFSAYIPYQSLCNQFIFNRSFQYISSGLKSPIGPYSIRKKEMFSSFSIVFVHSHAQTTRANLNAITLQYYILFSQRQSKEQCNDLLPIENISQ
jgi:hypothetical protein